jgi:hypothetical protein
MEVKLNPGQSVSPGAGQPVVRQQNIQPADNTMSFERSQGLEQILQQTSPLRPEAVAKASALVADSNYPPDGVLKQVAGLFANNLGSTGKGAD